MLDSSSAKAGQSYVGYSHIIAVLQRDAAPYHQAYGAFIRWTHLLKADLKALGFGAVVDGLHYSLLMSIDWMIYVCSFSIHFGDGCHGRILGGQLLVDNVCLIFSITGRDEITNFLQHSSLHAPMGYMKRITATKCFVASPTP